MTKKPVTTTIHLVLQQMTTMAGIKLSADGILMQFGDFESWHLEYENSWEEENEINLISYSPKYLAADRPWYLKGGWEVNLCALIYFGTI